MSGNRGCFFNSVVFLLIVFVPLLGHLVETIMIVQDEHSPLAMLGWLLVVWLIPFIGPLLYLLFGQHRTHVYFGRASYAPPPTYQQQTQTW